MPHGAQYHDPTLFHAPDIIPYSTSLPNIEAPSNPQAQSDQANELSDHELDIAYVVHITLPIANCPQRLQGP